MRDMKNLNCQQIGISMPGNIVDQIDTLRGDITRSRYITRLVETALSGKVRNENSDGSGLVTQPVKASKEVLINNA